MAAHDYWRVRVQIPAGATYTGIAEIELRETVGGADVTGSATVTAETTLGANGPARAVDGATGTWWVANGGGTGSWFYIQFDFTGDTPPDIAEVHITTPNSGSVGIDGLEIQHSDNGSDFTVTDTYTGLDLAADTSHTYAVTGAGGGGEADVAAFSVQHFQQDVASGGGTESITAVGALSSAIGLLNNSRYIGGGPDGSSASINVDDAALGMRLTATGTVTFDREGTAAGTNRASGSVWEYIGASGGPNEFIVRDRRTITLSAQNTATFTPSGISSASKVIPFITGIRHDNSGTEHSRLTACAEINQSTGEITVYGRAGDGTATIEITTAEFTGSNWSVAYGTAQDAADTGTITINAGVSDWANALLFHQFYKNASNNGIADVTCAYEPGANTTSVDWAFNANHDGNAGQRHVIYALHNADMDVTRYSSTDDSAGNVDVTISGPTDIAEALVVVSANSSGGGTAHLRGTRNAQITSTTNIQHYAHRSGNTVQINMQVAALPQDAAGGSTTEAGGSRSAARVGSAPASFTGAFTSTSSGVRTATRAGSAPVSFSGAFAASAGGLRAQSRTGSATGLFLATFLATGSGSRSTSRTGSSNVAYEGAFDASSGGVRSNGGAGSASAAFTGQFVAVSDGIRANSRTGSAAAAFSQEALTYPASAGGLRAVVRVGSAAVVFTGQFVGQAAGVQAEPRAGAVSSTFAGSFTAQSGGVLAQGRIGQASAAFVSEGGVLSFGVRAAARAGSAAVSFEGSFQTEGGGARAESRVGTVSAVFTSQWLTSGAGVRIGSRAGSAGASFTQRSIAPNPLRTVSVAAQSREQNVPALGRGATVPAQVRSASAPSQSRTAAIFYEPRTASAGVQNRSASVP